MRETLFLIDANSLVHRAFHALPQLTTPQGEPSGALYGLASILLKLMKEQRPTYGAAFFDRSEPTFRDTLYADYKAHRPPTADTLVPQIKEAPHMFEIFGIKALSVPGFEADDLIGTCVERFEKTPDLTILILSGDQDLLQLVEDNHVCVQYMRTGITDFVMYTADAVKEKYGLAPPELPDYKGLIGDASDNIPGVPGIGPKTARRLIETYNSVENIIEHLDEISPSIQKKLRGHEEQARLSKNLSTIHRMAPLPVLRLADLTIRSLQEPHLVPYFENLGFQSLIKRVYTTNNTLL